MPLRPGADVGESIRELHSGKTYRRTKSKYGKKKANKQAIAIALSNKRRGKKKARKHGKKRHRK